MPKVSVYLPDRLAAAVRAYDVPLSAVCQKALEQEVAARTPILSLTPRSRKLLTSAAREAELLGEDFIGTEHILLALLMDTGSLAFQAISELDLVDPIRERVREIIRRSRADGPSNRAIDMEGRLLGYMFYEEDGSSVLLWSDGRPVHLTRDDLGRIVPIDGEGHEFPEIPAASAARLMEASEEDGPEFAD